MLSGTGASYTLQYGSATLKRRRGRLLADLRTKISVNVLVFRMVEPTSNECSFETFASQSE